MTATTAATAESRGGEVPADRIATALEWTEWLVYTVVPINVRVRAIRKGEWDDVPSSDTYLEVMNMPDLSTAGNRRYVARTLRGLPCHSSMLDAVVYDGAAECIEALGSPDELAYVRGSLYFLQNMWPEHAAADPVLEQLICDEHLDLWEARRRIAGAFVNADGTGTMPWDQPRSVDPELHRSLHRRRRNIERRQLRSWLNHVAKYHVGRDCTAPNNPCDLSL
jgi:hypothetical protein